jgi:hypothetical protein
MRRGAGAWLIAIAVVSTSSLAVAQEAPSPAPPPPAAPAAAPPPPAAPAAAAPEVKLDLVIGEVKMLSLDDTKAWSVVPEVGLTARAVDDRHTLRLSAQKDGLYTLKLERNDGTVATYAVRVGKEPAIGPPAAVPVPKPIGPNAPPPGLGHSADDKYTRNTIDLNLEGGIGRHFGDPN